jgi:nucleotide-binding universal stress UspA family protein
MYKNILLPLDGSQRAEAILPHVRELAHRYDATVILLQVVESHPVALPPYGEPMELNASALQQHLSAASGYLSALEDELRRDGIRAEKYVEHGPVVETIINIAVREQADLIALASHGRSGLSRVFYGSVAAGLLHRVDRPLLLIRSREQD